MNRSSRQPWFVSLHGGHTGQYCDHAEGTLREIVEAAVERGFTTYGVAEHAPRVEERFLYEEEIALGWDIEKIVSDFVCYAAESLCLAGEFADRLNLLRGFEAEVVPADRYVEVMRDYRERFEFDYIVGSAHYVDEFSIDSTPEQYAAAMEHAGGLERLVVRYYETVAEMVTGLKPEVVGHIDVIRKFGRVHGPVDTPAIRRAAESALEVMRDNETLVDVNTGAYRKGMATPYPDTWLVRLARDVGVEFCFGDDSHGPTQVGAGIAEAREYLLENGVKAVTVLASDGRGVFRKKVPLD